MGIRFRLKDMRTDDTRGNDWTQEELARTLNMTVGNLRRLEGKDNKSISFDTLDKLCSLLNCEVQDLLVRYEDEPQEAIPEPPMPETKTGKVNRRSRAKVKSGV